MTTNSKAMKGIGQEGVVDMDAEGVGHANYTKANGLFWRMKNLIGKVVAVDEEWIYKSKDWPYLWEHKNPNDKA